MISQDLGTDPGLPLPQGRYQNAVFLLPLPLRLPTLAVAGRPVSVHHATIKMQKECLVLPAREEPIPATYNLPKNLMSSQSRG